MNSLPEKWGIGNDPLHPVLTVSAINPEILDADTFEEADVSSISRLSPLFQAVPAALASQHVAQHNFMEVLIDGPLAKVKDGTGFRAFSLGDNGKIKEHAILMDADKLGNIVNTGLLLQTASVLLAQKHLADINEKLLAISEDIKKISDFQFNERGSKITSTIKYLRQITPGLNKGELSPFLRQELEGIERQFIGIQEHLCRDILSTNREIETCADPDFFGTDGITREIKKRQETLQKHIVEWKLALSVRIYALQLVSLFDSDSILQGEREGCIRHDVENFKSILKGIETVQYTRIEGISALTESGNATNANKVMLKKWMTFHLFPQAQQTSELHLMFEHFSQRITVAKSQPTRLIIEMDKGEMVRLYNLK